MSSIRQIAYTRQVHWSCHLEMHQIELAMNSSARYLNCLAADLVCILARFLSGRGLVVYDLGLYVSAVYSCEGVRCMPEC